MANLILDQFDFEPSLYASSLTGCSYDVDNALREPSFITNLGHAARKWTNGEAACMCIYR